MSFFLKLLAQAALAFLVRVLLGVIDRITGVDVAQMVADKMVDSASPGWVETTAWILAFVVALILFAAIERLRAKYQSRSKLVPGAKSKQKKAKSSQVRISLPWLAVAILVGGVAIIVWVANSDDDPAEPATWVVPNLPKIVTKLPITQDTREIVFDTSVANIGQHLARDYLLDIKVLWKPRFEGESDEIRIEKEFGLMEDNMKQRMADGEGRHLPPNVGSTDRIYFPLTPTVFRLFQSGEGRVYLLRRMEWNDSNGHHAFNSCEYLSPHRSYGWYQCKADY